MNKKILMTIATGLLLASCGNTQNTETKKVEDSNPIIEYKETKLSRDDYFKELNFYSLLNSATQGSKDYILNVMLEGEIIKQDLVDKGIEVTDDEVEEQFKKYIELNGGKKNYETLKKDYGITDEDFKELARKEVAYQKHSDWFNENNPVEEKDLKEYFEKNGNYMKEADISHIVLDKKEDAEKVKKSLDEGKDFRDLAKEYSKDEYTKDRGGDLDFIPLSSLSDDAAKSVEETEESKYTDILEEDGQYQIIKVNKKKIKFEDFKKDITKELNESKYYDYLNNLKYNSKAKIDGIELKEPDTINLDKNNEGSTERKKND